MGSHTVWKTTPPNNVRGKSIHDKGRSDVKLEDLPRDLLCTILSKLPPKEVSRASVLSSHWSDICCFRLCFSGTAGYTRDSFERKEYCQYMKKFIDNVNTVVQKCRGKLVEEFNVKFEYDTMLVDHLNNWVNFAVSSRVKSIAVYLRPVNKRSTDVDRYVFPFHLLDSGSNMSHLQCIQLCFVSFSPPSDFRGFPSLRKLDLEFVHITIKDLQVILSNCSNLGWLSLVRCYLNGELKLDRRLSHLRHLIVSFCEVTRIELQVTKLVTFVYYGSIVPIVINQDSKLENAHIRFIETNFRDGVCLLLNGISSVQNLKLQIFDQRLERKVSLLNFPGKLSHLRCLQLVMGFTVEDGDKLSHVVSILRAAPLIEKLEINIAPHTHICFANKGVLGKQHLQRCEYNYLKSVHMTGYKEAKGQLEFLLHVVENATALEELIVETAMLEHEDQYARIYCRAKSCSERAAQHARFCLSERLSPKVKLCVT